MSEPLKPTVIGAVRRKTLSPTLMPGTTPGRFQPEAAELTGSDAAVTAALEMLRALVPAHFGAKQALFWGQEAQEDHRALTGQAVALSQAPALRETSAHLSRLRDILARIDLEAMAERGFGARIMARVNRLIDTPAELAEARGEIETLLRLLTQGQEALIAHQAALSAQARAMEALATRIEALALAAGWLASHTAEARALQDRRASLMASLVQLRANLIQTTSDAELPARLILAVQNIALVALPAWLSQAARGPRSLTEARDLAFRLHDIFPLFPKV